MASRDLPSNGQEHVSYEGVGLRPKDRVRVQVLIASTYDERSGAARAAYRLHQSLRRIGVDSHLLVLGKFTDDETVVGPRMRYPRIHRALRRFFDALPNGIYRHHDASSLSVQWLPDRVLARVSEIGPDLVNLQWICGGFLRIETISRFDKPLVWTLQDMWAFTGGCHYTESCKRYVGSCGKCPRLGSGRQWDLSHWIWRRKAKAWRNANLTVVAVSRWLADCARASSLFKDTRIEVIPNAVDTSLYKPIDCRVARDALNLPQDRALVLFGALDATRDPRKGFDLLRQALRRLATDGWGDKAELVVFGASEPRNPPDFGFPVHYLGHLHDDATLVAAYSAADVMVVPSVQEAFGQTGSEASACGTPVVAFDGTGLADIVEHRRTGYLARPFEIDDLARGIAWVLADEERRQALSHQARQKAENEFAQEVVARRYVALYEEILAQNRSRA